VFDHPAPSASLTPPADTEPPKLGDLLTRAVAAVRAERALEPFTLEEAATIVPSPVSVDAACEGCGRPFPVARWAAEGWRCRGCRRDAARRPVPVTPSKETQCQ
jgi:hypothetical protein